MVTKNTKTDKLNGNKKFTKRDTSYSSFWLYNKDADMNSQHFKDNFVDFYSDNNLLNKELLSEFNPTVAKNIINFWSDTGDLIFDPFSGRTRALVSYAMNRSYIGCEVSKDVVDYMNYKFSELNLFGQENFDVDIINDDCLNIDKYYDKYKFDMIFTCPPYWNLEKYESVKGQLSDINNYEKFLDELYVRLNESAKKLKENKFMVVVVGDFRRNREYISFHSDLIQKMKYNNMKSNNNVVLHDIIAVQNIPFATSAYYFGSTKKYKYTAKSHEYILVWRKTKSND